MDQKPRLVTEEIREQYNADLKAAEDAAAESMRRIRESTRSRMSASDWLTAVIVIGGFVTPLAVVLWRWALS